MLQVRGLIELFRPLHELPTSPTLPFLKKPMNNVYHHISGPPLSKHAHLSRTSPNQAPMSLSYKHVIGEHSGHTYPVHNIMPYSAAAQPVPSQASRNQFYSPASTLSLEGTYATGLGSSHNQTICGHDMTLQYSQHAHHNIIHPQPEFHSSLMPVGSSHTQSLQDLQNPYQSISNPQSLQDPQYPYQSIPNPQLLRDPQYQYQIIPNSQLLKDPQYPYGSIPKASHDFHPTVANAGSSHQQLSWDPYYTHQNIPNSQPNIYSTTLNAGHSYDQSLPDPQYTHQKNAQISQHDFQEFPSSIYSSQGYFFRLHSKPLI